ncbi:SAM-dependent methyltransferase [Nocardia pneumoniae]|uniref:SAM-dependent methyltransferase n=1 Tax=Nocardia pneumoniae TaxID=228601 RepID=UPI0012F6A9C8|nr:TrmO family methyltransferase [Nocardia pneumoniae]
MSAKLVFIGVISTPYQQVGDCPRQPWTLPVLSTIDIHPEHRAAVDGLTAGGRAHVLWWAHQADRRVQRRRMVADGPLLGVLAGRGVDRPNPIGLTLVEIVSVEGLRLDVRGMDCVTTSPLLDIKPAIDLPCYQ